MKTHATAIVVVPPENVWEPIQEIRRRHDRQIPRWMPHITLVYPFRPSVEFLGLVTPLALALQQCRAFEVTLAHFRCFKHGGPSSTVWLATEPVEPLVRLQRQLEAVVPECGDVSRYRNGFVPHLTVGQFSGPDHELRRFIADLQASWTKLTFSIQHVCLIGRDDPPSDFFRITHKLALGQ